MGKAVLLDNVSFWEHNVGKIIFKNRISDVSVTRYDVLIDNDKCFVSEMIECDESPITWVYNGSYFAKNNNMIYPQEYPQGIPIAQACCIVFSRDDFAMLDFFIANVATSRVITPPSGTKRFRVTVDKDKSTTVTQNGITLFKYK